jgi:hypothetical protein
MGPEDKMSILSLNYSSDSTTLAVPKLCDDRVTGQTMNQEYKKPWDQKLYRDTWKALPLPLIHTKK